MKEKTKATPRRSPGEASYRKRANGEWEGRITINYKPYSVYGKLRTDCVRKIENLKEKLNLGVSMSTPTVADWLKLWLKDVVAVDKKPSTVSNYTTIANTHLIPEIGRIRIDKLTQTEIQRLIAKKMRQNLAARSVRLIHHVLRCSLNVAVAHKLLASNPATGVVLPRIERIEMNTISPTEVLQLQTMDFFETEPLFPCFLLMLYTGLRRGEALALRWSDIDLERGTLIVQREIVKVAGGTKYQSTKTKHSNRLVPFGDALKSILTAHQKRQDEFIKNTKGYKNHDLVFARETGATYYPDSLRKILRRILKKAGIDYVRIHDLRHTCATLLMLSGVHPKVVQEILGHSNINVTLGTYSHTMPSMKLAAADSINDFVFASKPKPKESNPEDPEPSDPQPNNSEVSTPEKIVEIILPEDLAKLPESHLLN